MKLICDHFLTTRIDLPDQTLSREVLSEVSDEYLGVFQQRDRWFSTGAGGRGIFCRTQPDLVPCLYVVTRTPLGPLMDEQQEILPLEVDRSGVPRLPDGMNFHQPKFDVLRAREMWLKGNLRLSIDTVQGCGIFLNVDAVVDEQFSVEECKNAIARVLSWVKASPHDVLADTYAALYLQRSNQPPASEEEMEEIRKRNMEEVLKRVALLRDPTSPGESND